MRCGYVPTRISKAEQPAGMSPGTMGTGSPICTPVSGRGGQSLCAKVQDAHEAAKRMERRMRAIVRCVSVK